MAQNEVAMQAKLLAVLTAGLTNVNVAGLCADLGISRQTFYKYRRRFDAEGPAGLVARSRAPHRSPNAVSGELEDEIVRLRKTLLVDNGAQMIAYHLARNGVDPVPAVSTIHRVLVRRGLVTAQPHKRPKSATRRFVWPRPNDAWQIDATLWALADGREVWIMDVLDDHSRALVAARVCDGPTAAAACDALADAAATWGLPAHVMSDNGACFTSRFSPGSCQVDFEKALAALGIRHILSTPGHPQTCGKLERSHQTTKKWLAAHDRADTAQQLQLQLDDWRDHYNHRRPHRALRGATPAEIWHATDRAQPASAITLPPEATRHTVRRGRINYRWAVISVGAKHTGQQLLIINRDWHLTIYGPNGLVRAVTIDPEHRWYPWGNTPTGKRQPPRRIIGPCS
jgi:transposase InsO family protein